MSTGIGIGGIFMANITFAAQFYFSYYYFFSFKK